MAIPVTAHLRSGEGAQSTTSVELFFDLVFVFAVTQLSHLLLADRTAGGALRTAFLLVVVWWAWINTTWMVNRFDPETSRVRLILIAVMLASLLMAAAVPEALGDQGLLFAAAYVALQAGRNLAAMALLARGTPLRHAYERIVAWSAASGVLWLAGSTLGGDARLWVWVPALAVDLIAPFTGYWTPRLGRSQISDFGIEGSHFAERCQGFIILALGESIVVTGATAADAGLTTTTIVALAVAFAGTATLFWLYFGKVAAYSREAIATSGVAGDLARDAFTYLHLPIVAGIIVTAAGDDLLLAHPGAALDTAGALMVLGGPLLFLAGDNAFRFRMVGSLNHRRTVAMATLAGLLVVAPSISALALSTVALAVLASVALLEQLRGLG